MIIHQLFIYERLLFLPISVGSLRCERELLTLRKLREKRTELDPSIRSRLVQIYRLCVYTEHPDHKTLGFLIAALRDLVVVHQTSLGEILEWGYCRKRGTRYLRKTWTLFCFYSGVSDSQTALRNRERVKGSETERV